MNIGQLGILHCFEQQFELDLSTDNSVTQGRNAVYNFPY